MHAIPNDPDDRHMRVLIEQLVREGRSEQEITDAVRRAQREGGFVARTRRLSYFR
jgi:cytochrome c-type biogenesis protein CcmH/NrfF